MKDNSGRLIAFATAATIGVYALGFGAIEFALNSVPIKGRMRYIPAMERTVSIPLKGDFQGLSLPISGQELASVYQTAERNRRGSRIDFVETSRIAPVGEILLTRSKGDKIKYIQEVLKFVNAHLKYTKDVKGYWEPSWFGEPDQTPTDFSKFPIQSLYDGEGDCEEFSILAASLFAYGGIETGIAYSNHHAAVGFVLEDKRGIDQIVFDAARSVLGAKVKSTIGFTDSTRRANVTTGTKMTQLEQALEKDIPAIVGVRSWLPIDVTDWRYTELSPTVSCNRMYWTGDMSLSFHEIYQGLNGDVVRNTSQENTIGDILNDAIAQKRSNSKLNQILYRLPSDPHHFVAAHPVVELNDKSKCKPKDGARVFWGPIGGIPIANPRKLGSMKRKRIFYLEPQRTGFTLHSQIPMAVMWAPLPKEKYPQR